MKSTKFKLVELFVIFILMPISFTLNYPLAIKMSLGFFGFIYVAYMLLKVEKNKFRINPNLNWNHFWKFTLIKLTIIIVLTFLYMWLVDRDNLFEVILNKPKLWLIILLVYSLLSVYPQELVYRTFYFQRYKGLFSNEKLFIFINAIIFSLGHIFFRNALVILLTFLGGILFALTYNRSNSTLLVSVEHAIYGSWLFTVGMGSMLGFPS